LGPTSKGRERRKGRRGERPAYKGREEGNGAYFYKGRKEGKGGENGWKGRGIEFSPEVRCVD